MFKKNESLETLLLDAENLDLDKDQILYKIPDIIEWDCTENKIALGGVFFKLTEHALKQFLSKLKIPFNYYMACSPELRNKEIREAMEEQSGKVEYIFKVKNDTIYGIVSKHYHNMRTKSFIQKVIDNLPQGVSITEYDLTLDKVRLRVLSTEKEFISEDVIIPGVDILFSEVGATPYAINTVLHHKETSSSMMLPQGTAPSFKMPMTRFNEDEFVSSVSYIREDFFDKQLPLAELYERTKSIELPSFDDVEELPELLDTAKNLVIPSRLLQRDYKEVILGEYRDGDNDLTLHGLITAVNVIAKDLTVLEKDRLEFSAGSFLSRLYSLLIDAIEHEEEFEFSIYNFKRLFTRHS